LIEKSNGLPVVSVGPAVKLLPGVVSTLKTRVSAPLPVNGTPSPFNGTALKALTTSLNPGVITFAKLLDVAANWLVAAIAPVIDV
jgi:hypothetical protein